MPIKNDLLLKVARGESVQRPPVWVMRQAGRYLPEYRQVREKAGGFREMIRNPEFAAEVSLQPIDRFGLDAAIIFSDILVIAEALGLPYEMVEKSGPRFPETASPERGLSFLRDVNQAQNLEETWKAIRIVKKELNQKVPLIGFCGAPWTLFCYMTEGGGSKDFSKAKKIAITQPKFTSQLLDAITEASIFYLKGQIAAGADVIQIFDSWAGALGRDGFLRFSLPWIKKICDSIQDVPIIVFARGASHSLDKLNHLNCGVLGLDWATEPEFAKSLAPTKALQGNLDPCMLYASPAEVKLETLKMLARFPAGKHIANLGHGVFPDTPIDSVKAFVDTVQNFKYE